MVCVVALLDNFQMRYQHSTENAFAWAFIRELEHYTSASGHLQLSLDGDNDGPRGVRLRETGDLKTNCLISYLSFSTRNYSTNHTWVLDASLQLHAVMRIQHHHSPKVILQKSSPHTNTLHPLNSHHRRTIQTSTEKKDDFIHYPKTTGQTVSISRSSTPYLRLNGSRFSGGKWHPKPKVAIADSIFLFTLSKLTSARERCMLIAF